MLLLLLRNAEFMFSINAENINLWVVTSIVLGLLPALMILSMTKEGVGEENAEGLSYILIFFLAIFVLGLPNALVFYLLWLIIDFLIERIKNPPRRGRMFLKNFPFALRKVKETLVGIIIKKE